MDKYKENYTDEFKIFNIYMECNIKKIYRNKIDSIQSTIQNITSETLCLSIKCTKILDIISEQEIETSFLLSKNKYYFNLL